MEAMGASASSIPSPEPGEGRPLFSDSLSPTGDTRRGRGLPISIALHVIIASALILVPLLRTDNPPVEGVRAVLYNPPPPPPPPLALGSEHAKAQPVQPVTPEKKPRTPKDEPELTIPREEEPIKPEQKLAANEQQGSPDGTAGGDPEGMIGGVEGGVVGGVLGGVLGGVIGGTGDGLMDYDRPPHILRQPKPVYPAEAAVKRIEGKVVVEIILDSTGKVVDARVIESVPLLDQAAVRNVYEWVFAPALKGGQPVKALVHGVVAFRLL
jgi:protein TonB